VGSISAVFTVTQLDALRADIAALAASAGNEGFGMVERLLLSYRNGEESLCQAGGGHLGGACRRQLIGICGLNQDPFAAPGENARRVRRLYVVPGWRRRGAATRLLAPVTAEARSTSRS
jgi:hypothetical protein